MSLVGLSALLEAVLLEDSEAGLRAEPSGEPAGMREAHTFPHDRQRVACFHVPCRGDRDHRDGAFRGSRVGSVDDASVRFAEADLREDLPDVDLSGDDVRKNALVPGGAEMLAGRSQRTFSVGSDRHLGSSEDQPLRSIQVAELVNRAVGRHDDDQSIAREERRRLEELGDVVSLHVVEARRHEQARRRSRDDLSP